MTEFPKLAQVRTNHEAGIEIVCGRKWAIADDVVGDQSYSTLSLAVRVLIHGRNDDPFLKIWDHFSEQVRCDQDNPSIAVTRGKRATYR